MRLPVGDDRLVPDYATVIAAARELGLRTIRYPRHREIFLAALGVSRNEPDGLTLSKDLGTAVFAAATGKREPRLDIAALTFVLWVAFDVLDDIADGDAQRKWPDYGAGELTVMASSLIAATAHDIAATLHDEPAIRENVHLRIARGIAEMADGQIADIADSGRSDVSAERVFSAVGGKTGAECAMFAGLGAIVAAVDPQRQEAFEQFGFEYGMADQFITDLTELFGDQSSSDLANGTRTLPVVWHLEGLDGRSTDAFLQLLEAARTEPSAAAEVRTAITESGALRRTVLQCLIHIENARSALVRAQPLQPGYARLERMLRDLDPLGGA